MPVPDGHGNVKLRPAVILSPPDQIAEGSKLRVVGISSQPQDSRPAHHIPLP